MPTKPLDDIKSQIGTSKVTVEEFSIEAGKVEEFANAIHNDDPVHRDEEVARKEGYERIPVPPTFLMTKQFPRYKPEDATEEIPFDIGFDMARVLHGEQEFEFGRPVYVGDVLTGTTTLTDVYQKGVMTFAEMETKYYDENENHVATERMTIIESGEDTDE